MKRALKRLHYFIQWIIIQYWQGLINLITLRTLNKRSDEKYTKHWLFAKATLITAGLFFYLTGSVIAGFTFVFVVIFIFYLQEYEKEEWVGWAREKELKKQGVSPEEIERMKKLPWHMRPKKKEIL